MVIFHLEEQKTLDGFKDCSIDEFNLSLGYSDLCDSQFNRKSAHYQNVICFPCQLYTNEDGSKESKTESIENSYRCIIDYNHHNFTSDCFISLEYLITLSKSPQDLSFCVEMASTTDDKILNYLFDSSI